LVAVIAFLDVEEWKRKIWQKDLGQKNKTKKSNSSGALRNAFVGQFQFCPRSPSLHIFAPNSLSIIFSLRLRNIG
jgi:hypothetical protein